ncbi:methyltransferase, FxLD system [Streptomyces sp. WAC 01325]|uniref:methyltransferase, FxLD system n=1 Tax=Streptomyces sp. WAC 01325 TaxID=2203202 RepID=UPI00163C6E23|nr:methyltransferase, FxLD system [Streptomyces sp. WAC 01325]
MPPSSSSAPADSQSAGSPDELRQQLVDRLIADGRIRTPAVEAAFRRVPRHAFAPEVELTSAYADDVVARRFDAAGRATSSVSAPWLMAEMLEAARLRRGASVLEIGSGGNNAALVAEIVGEDGSVTTLDIDPAVTTRARSFLNTTGYSHVHVVTADGEHIPRELVPGGGFDAVIVTVESWDLPWIDLIAEGGRLVVPLRIHGFVWAIGFTKHNGLLEGDEPWTMCGFVPMQGAGAHQAPLIPIRGEEVRVQFEDGNPISTEGLDAAFDNPKHEVRTGVTVRSQEPFDNLQLWLAITLPGFVRLSVDPDLDTKVLSPTPPPHWPALAIIHKGSLARLAWLKITDDGEAGGEPTWELVVHGYGPASEHVAKLVAEQVRRWDRDHRTAGYPRIRATPATAAERRASTDIHLDKKHVRLDFAWSTTGTDTACGTTQ